MNAETAQADPGYRDVTCSFCERHNRQVHMVGGRDGLTICSICVARCADILDQDTGLAGPDGGWAARWPPKHLTRPTDDQGTAKPHQT
jgi:hypothetical protein